MHDQNDRNPTQKQPDFRQAMERGKGGAGFHSARPDEVAGGGQRHHGVWLGKQYLGQRDVTPIELSGPNGSAVKFSMEAIDAILAQTENSKGR